MDVVTQKWGEILFIYFPQKCFPTYTWGLISETCVYTGCPRRNVPDFGRVFLMLKCTDITQSTYVQS